jgi:hypothetical protein
MKPEVQIDVQDLDHLGIIAGIVDEIGIVEMALNLGFKSPADKPWFWSSLAFLLNNIIFYPK